MELRLNASSKSLYGTVRALIATSLVAAQACSGAQHEDERPRYGGVIAACVRRRAAARANVRVDPNALPPIAIDVTPEVRGHAAFDRVCGNCHPHAQADIGPRLVGAGLRESALRLRVRHGGLTMSAIPEECITDSDLTDIVAFLRTIGTVTTQ